MEKVYYRKYTRIYASYMQLLFNFFDKRLERRDVYGNKIQRTNKHGENAMDVCLWSDMPDSAVVFYT